MFKWFTPFVAISALSANEASLLFNGNCTMCHHETKSISAPSIKDVQNVYKQKFKKKDEFVAYMSKWVHNPNEKDALMKDAVKKYALMPELGFDKEMLKEISAYIYDTKF